MTTDRAWEPRNPAEAFFPVEMRPLFMPTADGLDKYQQLKRYHVPEKEMLPLLCRAFDIKATKDVVEKQRRVDDLLALREQAQSLTKAYFTEIGPHGYAALNVLTDYASRPAGVIAPEASMHGLQQKAGSWMDDFISAIKNPEFSFDRYLADYRQTAEVIESP